MSRTTCTALLALSCDTQRFGWGEDSRSWVWRMARAGGRFALGGRFYLRLSGPHETESDRPRLFRFENLELLAGEGVEE